MLNIKYIILITFLYTALMPMGEKKSFTPKYNSYKYWISREFDSNVYIDKSNTKLMDLIITEDYTSAIIFMDNYTKTLKEANQFGITPLMLAATKPDIVFITIIIKHLKFLEKRNDEQNYINKTDNEGRTAYDFAIMHNHLETALYLEKNGAYSGFFYQQKKVEI